MKVEEKMKHPQKSINKMEIRVTNSNENQKTVEVLKEHNLKC
jgi:hypothetical protein